MSSYITKDCSLKLQQSAQLEEQYKNNGLTNNCDMQLKVSCLSNHQAYI